MSKYKKQKAVIVDLSNRKNIKIVKSEKESISDEEIELFENQLKSLSEQAEEFHKYVIEQELKANSKITEEEFNATMKALMKQHKILKSLLKEQEN